MSCVRNNPLWDALAARMYAYRSDVTTTAVLRVLGGEVGVMSGELPCAAVADQRVRDCIIRDKLRRKRRLLGLQQQWHGIRSFAKVLG